MLQVPGFGIKSRRKSPDTAFLEISSGQTEQAGLKKCYERCFSHLKRMNKASCSQILRLEAETQSIVEWGLVGAAIFRPSAYFGIASSEKNRLRAVTRCYRLPRSTLPCQ